MAHIFVVDDQPEFTLATTALLRSAGHRVTSTSSPLVALDRAIEVQPDLVLLDVLMPGLSGWDVLELMRQHPLTVGIPLIMVSSLNDPSHRVRSLRAGASDFLVKPVDSEELLARIDRLLPAGEPEDLGLRGRIEAHPLRELLQSLDLHHRTGQVRVRSGSREGLLTIAWGQVAGAEIAGLTGNEAVWALLALDSGTFAFTAGLAESTEETDTVGRSLQGLLLEADWVQDELSRHRGALPALDATLEWVADPRGAAAAFAELPFDHVVETLRRLGRTTLGKLLAELPLASARAQLAVALLVEQGALRAKGRQAHEPLPERHRFAPECLAVLESDHPERRLSLALLAELAVCDEVRGFLLGLPTLSSGTSGSRIEIHEVEHAGWRVRILFCPLDLDRVFEVFRVAAASSAVFVWLATGRKEPAIPLRLIAAAAGPRARLEVLRPEGGSGEDPAIPVERWRRTLTAPAGLAGWIATAFGVPVVLSPPRTE